MKAIVTKYHGPGNVRGARYSATDNDGNRVSVQASDVLNSDQNHRAACRKLCLTMGWAGTLVQGALLGVGQVFVWRQERLLVADELVIQEIGGAK